MTTIRRLESRDLREWGRMRTALWPDQSGDDMAAWVAQGDAATFVAADASGRLCGFIEVGERPFADGCDSRPVAYVEGWYVDPDARRCGVGAALVRAAEDWARARGHREIASDADVENDVSNRAHERLGFDAVGRVVHYRKRL